MKRYAAVLIAAAMAACAPKRTPCDQTVGADACSMIPRRMTCDCDGKVVRAESRDQPVACGQVRTVCIGDVTAVRDEDGVLPWRSARDASVD